MSLRTAQLSVRDATARFFRGLSRFAVRAPRRVIAMAVVVTLFAALGIGRLKLRTDGHALLAPDAPEALYDRTIRERFAIEDDLVVLIRSGRPEGIFNPATVQLVRDLTAEFARIPEINPGRVMSLATEPSFRFRPGTYEIQHLLEPALTNKAELDQLREDLRRIELYTGTLVSADGKSTVILIGTPTTADRPKLYQKVLEIIAAKNSQLRAQASRLPPDEIAVTGAPVAEALLGIHILEDLGVPNALLGTSTRSHTDLGQWNSPANWSELRLLIARRIGLVPLAMLVMLLIFLVSFRNVVAALVPLPGVLATLLFVFGVMGWAGVPIYLTMAVMPVLLAATGVTNDIYLFNRYFTLFRENPGASRLQLLDETFDKIASPLAGTSLTTAIAFLSFAFSPLGPVRSFGIITALGVAFGLFYSLTVVPATLALIPPAWLLPKKNGARAVLGSRSGNNFQAHPPLAAWFARFGQSVVRRRRLVATLVLLAAFVTPLGLRQLVVQDSWIDGFDPSSEFRRATRQVNEQFYGMHLLLVSLDSPQALRGEVEGSNVRAGVVILPANLVADPALIEGGSITLSIPDASPAGSGNHEDDAVCQSYVESAFHRDDRLFVRFVVTDRLGKFWQELPKAGRVRFEIVIRSHTRPELIRTCADLASFIRERRQLAVGGVLGPADYLLTTRFMLRHSDPQARRLPDNAAEIGLLWNSYAEARGPHRLRQVVDTNCWQSLTTVFLKDANFVGIAKLMSDLRAYEREHLAPKGIKLGFAGDVALSQSLIRGIVATQLQSLFWSLAGIYLVTATLGGSLRWGLYCVLPSLFAILIKFAVMGWTGISLGVATSMFAAMTLGIGVNCAIQLLASYDQARAEARSLPEALSRAMALTGPPALINTIALSLGFGVLMLSQVPANARLGFLLVLGLMGCFVVSLLLLPLLLHWWPLKIPLRSAVSNQ